jgi:hypothetical protein
MVLNQPDDNPFTQQPQPKAIAPGIRVDPEQARTRGSGR